MPYPKIQDKTRILALIIPTQSGTAAVNPGGKGHLLQKGRNETVYIHRLHNYLHKKIPKNL